jgi:hypothetical protein
MPDSARAKAYVKCDTPFAACMTSRCQLTSDGKLACPCNVQVGSSAGHSECFSPVLDESGNLVVLSRYADEFSDRAVCNNDLPWADCLDKPCRIDATDPSKATCLCEPMQDSGPYVVTGTASTSACNDGKTYSSALIHDDLDITHFLSLSESARPVCYNF